MNLVFDIGATHMRIAECTEEGIGTPVILHTPQDPQAAIALFVATAHSLGQDIEKVAGGVAGSVDDEGIVSGATNLPDWNGFAFQPLLSEALGVDVVVHNDAELNGLGEAHAGAGKGSHRIAYLGIGTGVGTAFVVEGNIVPGSGQQEQRLRIITLSDGTTLEERIGGRALEARYGMPPPELAPDIWATHTPYLAEGVRNAIREWKPDIVVLGGSLVNSENGFHIDAVAAEVQKESDSSVPAIRAAELGGLSGLWGARELL